MEYSELLKRAKMSLPKGAEEARWEMPRADVAVTGKMTAIRNFADIAKALRREPVHIAKYLFKELAVPGSVSGNQLMLQGKFGGEQINRRLGDYVKEFVLCGECKKPDTMLVKQDRLMFVKCEACGARRPAKHI